MKETLKHILNILVFLLSIIQVVVCIVIYLFIWPMPWIKAQEILGILEEEL